MKDRKLKRGRFLFAYWHSPKWKGFSTDWDFINSNISFGFFTHNIFFNWSKDNLEP